MRIFGPHPSALLSMATCALALGMGLSGSVAWADGDDGFNFNAGVGGGVKVGSVVGDFAPTPLIRVETNLCRTVNDTLCVVLMQGQASAAFSTSDVGDVDVQYDVVGGEFDVNHDQSLVLGSSLFGVNIERNVAINEDYFVRLTFVGFRGRGKIEASKNLELFAQASVDILGYGIAEGVAQARKIQGLTQSGNLSVGATIAKRVKVTLSESLGYLTGSQNVQVVSGAPVCQNSLDPTGATITQTCSLPTQSEARDHILSSSTQLGVDVMIFKHLMLFAEASYTYFNVRDLLGGAATPTAPPITSGQGSSTSAGVAAGSPINSSSSEFEAVIGLEVTF